MKASCLNYQTIVGNIIIITQIPLLLYFVILDILKAIFILFWIIGSEIKRPVANIINKKAA